MKKTPKIPFVPLMLSIVMIGLIIVLVSLTHGLAKKPDPVLKPLPNTDQTTVKQNDAGTIKVALPTENAFVTSPIKIEGEAAGSWFFEGVFPIKIVDDNGNILGQGQAKAVGDWQTQNMVKFTASIPFSNPTTSGGTIILEKDNPSGLPANADSFGITIAFQQ